MSRTPKRRPARFGGSLGGINSRGRRRFNAAAAFRFCALVHVIHFYLIAGAASWSFPFEPRRGYARLMAVAHPWRGL